MQRERIGAPQLGVKARLSNQEMEQLRHQLAQATAYAHVVERAAKFTPASKPMTKIYKRVESENNGAAGARPGRKTQASIQYEQRFTQYDSLQCRPAAKGISSAAKTVLQDEYVAKPRHLLVRDASGAETQQEESKHGRKPAPVPIPQVFLL